MKHLNKVLAAILISGGLLGSAVIVQADSDKHDSREAIAMSEASVTMDKAIEIALAAVSGTPKEVEFEMEDGKPVWEVEIVSNDKRIYEIEIDANSGEVLEQELED